MALARYNKVKSAGPSFYVVRSAPMTKHKSPTKRGRPTLRRHKRRTLYVTVRVSPQERARMLLAAKPDTLTEWARRRLLA